MWLNRLIMNFYKYISVLCLCLCSLIGQFSAECQVLNVTQVNGHEYNYKPNLSYRLDGIKEVIVFAPRSMSKYDNYIFPILHNYFYYLGLKVSTKYVNYKVHRTSEDYLDIVWQTLDESLDGQWDNANTLLVVASNVSTIGKVTGDVNNILRLYIIDPVANYEWDFSFDLPEKSEKFHKKLKELISPSYTYIESHAHSPSYFKSGWTENTFKSYFSNNNYHPIEGVYEGDTYKVGVKRDANGKFYLVYLSGASNTRDWSSGDIKAILEPTASPTIFKAKWYGKWKQQMNYTIVFQDGIMTAYDPAKTPEPYLKLYPALISNAEDPSDSWTGTGFALKEGYIVTNYHVIDGAKTISVSGIKGDFGIKLNAIVVGTDKNNDLALIKISDSKFTGFGNIPYSIATSSSDVGEYVYVLGYPLTSTMGDEIKLTTGIISSKTGYQGDVSLYQISAPIQPGNSGGPLFNNKGNVIGVVNSKHTGAENVGYAIKAMYLRNLIESCVSTSIIPAANTVSSLPLTGKVKSDKNFVFLIECTSKPSNQEKPDHTPNVAPQTNYNNFGSNPSSTAKATGRTINNPSFNSTGDSELKITSITLSKTETVINFSCVNHLEGGWMNMSKNAYIMVGGIQYMLKRAEGIQHPPYTTIFDYPGQIRNFKLVFPPIPESSKTLDFIEGPNSHWKIYGVKLK